MYSSVRRAPIVVGTVGLCCCCVDGLFAVVPPVAFIVVLLRVWKKYAMIYERPPVSSCPFCSWWFVRLSEI